MKIQAPFGARGPLPGWAHGRAFRALAAAATVVAALAVAPAASAADDSDWIGTWAASAQPVWGSDFAVPIGLPANYWKQTLRQVARVSIGGDRVRVELSNEYGDRPLMIGAAHIALAGKDGAIEAGSDHELTFGGKASITIPPGAPVLSDPVDLKVEPLAEVSVSLYFPELAPATTVHWDGHQTAYVTSGNTVAEENPKADSTQTQRAFLTDILVEAPADARAVVLFGDSITDGDGSTVDGNDRWPDRLAERLVKEGGTPVAVLNHGISGDKVLSDRMGVNALARFDRDVLSQPKADTVVLMMGVNDIGWPGSGLAPDDTQVSAEAIIAAYKQMIARAHVHGMRIIGATLTPFGDAFAGTPFEGYYSDDKEKIRVTVNDFIRGGDFDGVIDFDKVVVDPDKPGHIRAEFDKGDHLHPNAAGYEAMGKAIDLQTLAAH